MKHLVSTAWFICITLLFVSVSPSFAQVQVIREWKHAVSAPLRDLVLKSGTMIAQGDPEEEEEAPAGPMQSGSQTDPVLQTRPTTTLVTVPGLSFLGLGSGFTGPQGPFQFAFAPPDPNSAVGPTQIVENVNLSFAVFNKTTGATVLGPVPIAILWKGFNSSCSNTTGVSLADPIVLYDRHAGRWLMKIGTLDDPYFVCLAVSTSADATGSYNLYAFSVAAEGRQSGQKMSTWPDAYYIAQWTFTTPSTYLGPAACALDRAKMVAGQTATMQCIQINSKVLYGMIPSDLDGSNLPPAGSPNYFLVQGPPGSNSLFLFRFHVDFTTPANSKLTGPFPIAVAPYKQASRDNVVAIPQPGTSQLLDVNGSDLMHRLTYRNFSNVNPAHESLMVNHSVIVGTGTNSRTAVRWYELRSPGTTPTVYQQGTYSPDTTNRWMASIAMDSIGDMAMGYSVSTSTIFPSIRYTGRAVTDPLNTMETEATLFTGTAVQTNGGRWGDYTSMSVGPADDCTMWYTGQYMGATGPLNWATRIYSFKFPACP
jgi:hypothetical protein